MSEREITWNKCPYTGEKCKRLSEGHTCILLTEKAEIGHLIHFCKLDEFTIQKIVEKGYIKPPEKPPEI